MQDAEDWTAERLEKEIEGPATRYAEYQGWLEIKIAKSNKRGWPDRFFGRAGVAIFVEFKRPGEEPSPQQKKRHKELRGAGFRVYVIDNVELAHVVFR